MFNAFVYVSRAKVYQDLKELHDGATFILFFITLKPGVE